ncbi:MAG: uncharacterized protein KVP18_003546, partial [Porospora cf. gigantea A]|uniref:uncharacterized protein n=2 Tax=Porospora cf. gigantea A TaxID=2853593 RepID=UPI0035598BEE
MIEKYVIELGFACLLVLVAITFVRGKRRNQQIADEVFGAIRGSLEAHFSVVGCTPNEPVKAVGYDAFDVWASGHPLIKYLLVKLDTRSRQEFWVRYLLSYVFSQKDSLHVEVELENLRDSFALLILKKTKVASAEKLHDSFEGLKFMRLSGNNLPTSLAAVADNEQVSAFLTPQANTWLEGPVGACLQTAFVGDLLVGFRTHGGKNTIQIELDLPQDLASLASLVKLVVHWATLASELSLKDKSKKQVQKARASIAEKVKEAEKEKAEQAKQERRRQQRLAEEEKYNRMSTAEKRKY